MTQRARDAEMAMELGRGSAQKPSPGILIGYARCSTENQDLTAQRQILRDLGVTDERVYLDHGLTGRNRSRPGLNNALAALREGDTLVSPSSTVSPAQSPTRERSETRSPLEGFACRLAARSMTRTIRWANVFSTSSRPSLSSRSTCYGCAPAKGWRSPAPKADSRARRPSSARPTDGAAQTPPGWRALDRRARGTVLC